MSEMLGHSEHASSGTPASKTADKRKQTILVITGVVGVGLTYLLWRHSSSSANTAATAAQGYAQPSGVDTSGTGGGANGVDYSGALNAIGSQLASQQSAYSSLEAEFNSKLATLTNQNTVQEGQIRHLGSTLSNQNTVQEGQIKRIEHIQQGHTKTLTRTPPGHAHKQATAHKNTHQTKKASRA